MRDEVKEGNYATYYPYDTHPHLIRINETVSVISRDPQ